MVGITFLSVWRPLLSGADPLTVAECSTSSIPELRACSWTSPSSRAPDASRTP
jgi:hypothetical protein